MAYKFPLATVLRYRESLERREERALQAILADMGRIRRAIESVSAEIVYAQNARNEAIKETLPAVNLQGLIDSVHKAIDRKNALIEALAETDKRREAQTERYQAAHRDRQMLSDMQTKQRDAHEQQRARAEQKVLDDIFAARSQRS